MCYGPRDRELEEEARRLRAVVRPRREWRGETEEARWDSREKEEKPLTEEEVREVVGSVG
jgi:hypothetical protein